MMKYMAIALSVLMAWQAAMASNNIDLSTVPKRQTVQLTIYNAEDLTLVRETRLLTFKKGNNPLQFSWANTLIDPTSVELKFLSHADALVVLDTTYPHDKPQMLYWNVASEFAGEAKVEISYFTSGITWSADYTGIAADDGQMMALSGYVTVVNNSGEDYQDAQIRLVVGKVNLVEKIAALAAQGMFGRRNEGAAGLAKRKDVRMKALRSVVASPAAFDLAEAIEERPREIIKEGLSEYFIFTIEGTQTVKNSWSKRMLSFHTDQAVIETVYRYRVAEYGDQLVKLYLLRNDTPSGMGQSPLPDGQVRLFRRDANDGLHYLASQAVSYIPIGDKIELNLGVDAQVQFELVPMQVTRDNIWGTWDGKIRRRFDAPGVRVKDSGRVTGWDDHTDYAQRIRNYTDRPIQVEVRRIFDGDVTFTSDLKAKSHNYRTIEYVRTIAPGEKASLGYRVTQRHGENAKQNRAVIGKG